jgi:CubicO group peptidase (beta-lactamase class C family)
MKSINPFNVAVVAACLLLGSSCFALTTTEKQQKLEQLLASVNQPAAPGMTVLVRVGDEVLLRRATGLANLELQSKMQPDMVMRLASQTKQFTAVATLILVQQGKLKLTSKVRDLLPDYPALGKDLTVHQLLSHSTGLKNLSRLPEFRDNKAKDASLTELLALFDTQPLQFAPGSQFAYSNSNYVLLTALIEKASGQSYASYLAQHIFQPLGMSHSGYDHQQAIIPQRAAGYTPTEQGFANAEVISMTRPQGAGGLYSNVDDLNLWDQALAQHKLLTPELTKLLFTKHKTTDGTPQPYGYGFMMADLQGLATQEHSGGIEGFTNYIIRIPARQVYVAVLSNNEAADTYSLAVKMAAIAIDQPFEPEAVQLSKTQISAISGTYQFEDEAQRIISIEKGNVFSERVGGAKLRLIPTKEGKFYIENDFNYFTFSQGKALYQMRGMPAIAGKKL